MSTNNKININVLMRSWPDGAVYTQEYLSSLGYYHDLVRRYKKSGWIEAVGRGAYKKGGDTIHLENGVATLQRQLGKTLHPGGRTALEMHGYGHYARFSNKSVFITVQGERVPAWFEHCFTEESFSIYKTNLFGDSREGLAEKELKAATLIISSPERAAMEMCYLIPKHQGFDEADKIMGGLMTLRPGMVAKLLKQCSSVKTKRLFLYLAERNQLPWFEHITMDGINLGSGKRVIGKGGVFDAKYQISVPELRNL